MSVTVLMPCLNEAETVAACVELAHLGLSSLGVSGDVLVADNGSTDGSDALALAAGAKVVHVPSRGYGAALRAGTLAASGDFIIMADADLSYDLSHLSAFIDALDRGHDLVIGNRFAGGIASGAMPLLHRFLGNPVLSALGRLFFRVPVKDFHCGMRAFRRESVLSLDLRSSGMEYASEMVVRAALAGLDITEVPTTLAPDGRSKAPHLRTWADGWRHLVFLLALTPRWLLTYPAMAALAGSITMLTVLALGPVSFLGHGLGVHTMLASATFVIVAIQLLTVAGMAEEVRRALRPQEPRAMPWQRRLTPGRGAATGLGCFLAGISCYVASLLHWQQTGFGDLNPATTMSLPILGTVLVCGGVQVAVSGIVVVLVRYVVIGLPEVAHQRTNNMTLVDRAASNVIHHQRGARRCAAESTSRSV